MGILDGNRYSYEQSSLLFLCSISTLISDSRFWKALMAALGRSSVNSRSLY